MQTSLSGNALLYEVNFVRYLKHVLKKTFQVEDADVLGGIYDGYFFIFNKMYTVLNLLIMSHEN